MKIGIIGAMPQEVAILIDLMQEKTQQTIAHCTFYQGKIAGKEVVVMQSGIGKVAASMGATLLLSQTQPDIIINTGSAGGVGANLLVGDVVISTATCHHDADVTAFGYEKGQLPQNPTFFPSDEALLAKLSHVVEQNGQRVQFGLIASGDRFIQGGKYLEQIKQDFPQVVAVEMEAAAIAQVCYAFATPFVVVRAISDNGDGQANICFDEFLPIASKHSADMIVALLQTL